MIQGHNNDVLHEHSLDHHLEFFSKAGSLYTTAPRGRKAYEPYGGNLANTTALALFQAMWIIPGLQARLDALKLLFWLRNPRGGAGNRSGFRACLTWLATAPGGAEWLIVNMDRIREYGRCDDWKALFGTPLEALAAETWAKYIKESDYYALKWAKRDMIPLQRAFKTNEAGLRRLLREYGRKSTEQHMCGNLSDCKNCGKVTHWMHKRNSAGEHVAEIYVCENCGATRRGPVIWKTIEYSKVESKCMAQSNKAFLLHDPSGFQAYKEALTKGETDIKAAVLFPHDCLKSAVNGDAVIADAQFAALPNYMEETGERIMAICDTSASMRGAVVGGSTTALDVSKALGLYCSDKLAKDNPFYRKYMEFSETPDLIDWANVPFHDQARLHLGKVASTNIQRALDYMLTLATMFRVTPDQMISTILLLSDMQFDQHVSSEDVPAGIARSSGGYGCLGTEATVVEQCMQRWEAAGFKRPRIVYWNLAGYAGQPATVQTPNTALVSGFSPSILKAVLSGDDFTPLAVMKRTIENYEVTTPSGAA